MDILKNKIIDKIISLLSPLRKDYQEEINIITNDLINNKTDSLINFINEHYNSMNYSPEIKEFVKKLVNSKIIDKDYLNMIKDNNSFELTSLDNNNNNIILLDNKPLNIKKEKIERIIKDKKSNRKYKLLTLNAKNYFLSNSKGLNVKENILKRIILSVKTIKFKEEQKELSNNNDIYEDNIISFNDYNKYKEEKEEIDINLLRKKILEGQVAYINDANKFIQNLEDMDEVSIYNSIMNLNDIRFIQHSISKLTSETLERLLNYVENRLENEEHNFVDMFIEEAIKKNLHKNKKVA